LRAGHAKLCRAMVRIGAEQTSYIIDHKGEFSPSRNRGHLVDILFPSPLNIS
jgi:hypothetical protein